MCADANKTFANGSPEKRYLDTLTQVIHSAARKGVPSLPRHTATGPGERDLRDVLDAVNSYLLNEGWAQVAIDNVRPYALGLLGHFHLIRPEGFPPLTSIILTARGLDHFFANAFFTLPENPVIVETQEKPAPKTTSSQTKDMTEPSVGEGQFDISMLIFDDDEEEK